MSAVQSRFTLMVNAKDRERNYFDTLRLISQYQPPDQIKLLARLNGGGSGYLEMIENSYENAIATARAALRGKRRPV